MQCALEKRNSEDWLIHDIAVHTIESSHRVHSKTITWLKVNATCKLHDWFSGSTANNKCVPKFLQIFNVFSSWNKFVRSFVVVVRNGYMIPNNSLRHVTDDDDGTRATCLRHANTESTGSRWFHASPLTVAFCSNCVRILQLRLSRHCTRSPVLMFAFNHSLALPLCP